MEEHGTWASRTQERSEAGYGRPVDRGVWTTKTVKRPPQQPAQPQYANYWAPLTCKRHIPPHPAQPQHTSYWAPRTRKRHQREHRPQRPTERSDPTQHAKGRTGDCPGPCKETTTRRNVTRVSVGPTRAAYSNLIFPQPNFGSTFFWGWVGLIAKRPPPSYKESLIPGHVYLCPGCTISSPLPGRPLCPPASVSQLPTVTVSVQKAPPDSSAALSNEAASAPRESPCQDGVSPGPLQPTIGMSPWVTQFDPERPRRIPPKPIPGPSGKRFFRVATLACVAGAPFGSFSRTHGFDVLLWVKECPINVMWAASWQTSSSVMK